MRVGARMEGLKLTGKTALPRHLPAANAGASAKQQCSRRRKPLRAQAAQRSGSDGRDQFASRDSINAEWQDMRMGPLWQSLDADLDRCWAAHSMQEEADVMTTTEDSWDGADSPSTSAPTFGYPPARPNPSNMWPSTARSAYMPAPGQQILLHDLSQVYVILFGVGSTETEGIYSLRVMSRNDGLPQDTIIAFASKEDADRYAGLLEATMDHVPSVCPIEPVELLDFCTDSGYSYRVEAQGSLLIPPDYYVGVTDWERSMRLREGKWSVMERDLSTPPTPPTEMATPSAAELRVGNNATLYPMTDSSYLLEEARARLERLLPKDC